MAQEKQPDKAVVEFVPFGGDSKLKLSITIVKELICVKTKTGKICSDTDAIKFMAMCQARKLNPFEGDAFLIGYDNRDKPNEPNFSLITAHQAFLKRAEVNDEYDGMESGVVVEKDGKIEDIAGDFTSQGQKVVGGWARVHFKNRKYPMYKRLRLSRFQKPFGIWQEDPAGMIVKCAEADALRSSFPTMLGGLYIQAEQPTQTIEIVEAKVVEPATKEISNGRAALTRPTTEESTSPAATAPTSTEQTAAPSKNEAPPVRKKSPKLKPKEEKSPFDSGSPEPSAHPNRDKLSERLRIGGYTEDQLLAVCNKNEWLGKGRKWDNIDDVPDDMWEVFLREEEWDVVSEQLEMLPRHTKD